MSPVRAPRPPRPATAAGCGTPRRVPGWQEAAVRMPSGRQLWLPSARQFLRQCRPVLRCRSRRRYRSGESSCGTGRSRGARLNRRVRIADDLEQHSAGACRMNEEVAVAARAGADAVAGQANALGAKPVEEGVNSAEADRQVMRSLAALGQEAADGGILGGRFEQFDARAAQREHGGLYLLVFDRLFVRGGDAERCIESTRLSDAAHRDSDVIELGMIHQGLNAASGYGVRGSTAPAGWARRDESFDLGDQLVYSFASGCHGTDNRRQPDLNSLPRPLLPERLHGDDLPLGAVRAVQIGL